MKRGEWVAIAGLIVQKLAGRHCVLLRSHLWDALQSLERLFGVSVGIGVKYMGSCRFNGTISNFILLNS
jgi:hypothetical protein